MSRLRIPLLTGDAFAMGVAWATCLLVPAGTVALAAIPLYVKGHWIVATLCLLAGAFFSGAFWGPAKKAWVERPSDLVLDDDGFRVVGGPGHGLRARWADLAHVKLARVGSGAELTVTHSGERSLVARTFDEPESLADVRDVLVVASSRERPRPLPGEIALLVCATCGAPIVPVDAESTTCRSCSAAFEVPGAVRDRMKELATRARLSAQADRLLRRILRHPASGVARAGVIAFGALAAVAWPVSLAAFSIALFRDELFSRHLAYVFFPAGIALAASIASSFVVMSRGTVRAVALGFTALPPPSPNEPSGCRLCGAPLASAPGSALLVGCVYCRAVNVLGMSVPRPTKGKAAQASELDELLMKREGELLFRGLGFLLFGVPALVFAGFSVRAIVHPNAEVRARIACHRGDAQVCRDLEARHEP